MEEAQIQKEWFQRSPGANDPNELSEDFLQTNKGFFQFLH